MADKRKLQSDIDRTLKRVQDGRSSFQDTLDKFESSCNQAQKEKFEGDLKKEIKKLQRLRDQIKTWLTASEVKDKQPLLEARKEIEQDMERFKVIEKETKTKAYSKEGLLSTDAKKDPQQKEKEELDEWLKQCISSLNTQMEKYEFEIESLTNNNKKKRIDKETAAAIDEKRQRLENCGFHVEKLETVMRLLDNERLDCALLKSIKEPIEYVIQSCDDPSSLDYRDMYDDLHLDEIGDSSGITPVAGTASGTTEHDVLTTSGGVNQRPVNDDAVSSTSTHTSASNNTESSGAHPTSSASSNASSRERTKSEDKASAPSHAQASSTSTPLKMMSNVIGAAIPGGKQKANLANQTAPPALMSQVVAGTPMKSTKSNASHITSSISQNTPADVTLNKSVASSSEIHAPTHDSQPRTPKADHNSKNVPSSTPLSEIKSKISNASDSLPEAIPSAPRTTVGFPHLMPKGGFAAVLASPVAATASSTTGTADLSSTSKLFSSTTVPHTSSLAIKPSTLSVCSAQPQDNRHFASVLANPQSNLNVPLDTQSANLLARDSSLVSKLHPSCLPSITPSQPQQTISSLEKQLSALPSQLHGQQMRPSQCIQMHPRDAAAPFRNRILDKPKTPLPQELVLQMQALENAYRRLSHPCDTEKARMIICKNIVNGPAYYPREPLPGTDTEEYYMKLDAQTLFFIFYYFEGTKAQYFAAKALKRMSWRFHTKYMMWFQRHEEPKQITDEFESGSYIYYDFKSMSQRKKEEFVFHYSFLEDKDF